VSQSHSKRESGTGIRASWKGVLLEKAKQEMMKERKKRKKTTSWIICQCQATGFPNENNKRLTSGSMVAYGKFADLPRSEGNIQHISIR
jgi:hypothetical protein